MQHLVSAISSDSLQRVVVLLERRIIAGTARADDIDSYVSMQCELANRELADRAPGNDDAEAH